MRALVITGEYGAGKSTVAAELTHQLSESGVRTAAIDLDWLAWVGPDLDPDVHERLLTENLATLADNFRRIQVERLVIAGTLRTARDRDLDERAMGCVDTVVVLLLVDHHEALRRIRSRNHGRELQELLDDADTVAAAVQHAGVEDFAVDNNPHRRVELVANEALRRAGWPTAPSTPSPG